MLATTAAGCWGLTLFLHQSTQAADAARNHLCALLPLLGGRRGIVRVLICAIHFLERAWSLLSSRVCCPDSGVSSADHWLCGSPDRRLLTTGSVDHQTGDFWSLALWITRQGTSGHWLCGSPDRGLLVTGSVDHQTGDFWPLALWITRQGTSGHWLSGSPDGVL